MFQGFLYGLLLHPLPDFLIGRFTFSTCQIKLIKLNFNFYMFSTSSLDNNATVSVVMLCTIILPNVAHASNLPKLNPVIENLKTKVSKDIVYVDDGNGKMICRFVKHMLHPI